MNFLFSNNRLNICVIFLFLTANYGTIEAFFSFYKSKVYFEDFAPFFWAFVSSASIIVEEQMTITR